MVPQKLPYSSWFSSVNWRGFFALILLLVIFLSFIVIIQLQHQIRHLETQYAKALQQEVALQEELGKLKLEKHHLSALARVEDLARTELHMSLEKSTKLDYFQTIILENAEDAPPVKR